MEMTELSVPLICTAVVLQVCGKAASVVLLAIASLR